MLGFTLQLIRMYTFKKLIIIHHFDLPFHLDNKQHPKAFGQFLDLAQGVDKQARMSEPK
jgi:hypothetical protein